MIVLLITILLLLRERKNLRGTKLQIRVQKRFYFFIIQCRPCIQQLIPNSCAQMGTVEPYSNAL